MNDAVAYAMTTAFSLLVACFITAAVSALALWFKRRRINAAFKHPFLQHNTFERYPLAIRASIMQDYFFRIAFPKSRLWIIGSANKLLADVEPRDVPLGLKWPIVGLWGGCWVGIIAMIVLWATLMMRT